MSAARWPVSEPISPTPHPHCTCGGAILWEMDTGKTRWLHTRECTVSISEEIGREYYSGPPGSYTGD